MIAFANKAATLPVDVGCIFPYGRGNRHLRIYLITNDPLDAQACGLRFQSWGLPADQRLVQEVALKTAIVQNPFQPKQYEPLLNQVTFPVIKFGGHPLALGTTDSEEVVAFARWLTHHYTREKREKEAAKAKAPPSLNDLADAGEIETIEG